jgi:L-lactate utilization protein LutC
MMKMPSEFGTAKELRELNPQAIRMALTFNELTRTAKANGAVVALEELRSANMMLSAQLEWALAAIDELQDQVRLLQGQVF